MNNISVIISAYCDHELTVVHVREIMNSTVVPDEIIVVNDGGEPDLLNRLKKLKFNTKVIYARIKEDIKWNYTGARNLGFWLARGEFISIEDNDHIPNRTFYEDCLKYLKERPDVSRVKTHKRFLVSLEDVLNKPMEEWVVQKSKVPHQDTTMVRRELFLKLKGFDERFAGSYGWCSTDWRRRVNNGEFLTGNCGYQYTVNVPSKERRSLSHKNYMLARRQDWIQSPKGVLNFMYDYEQIN